MTVRKSWIYPWVNPWSDRKGVANGFESAVNALNPYAWYSAEYGQPKNVGYVQLDGTSGDYVWTADSVVNDISGDIEVVMRVKATDWTAAANQTLAGKYVTTSNQRSWRFYVSTTGAIVLTASADGIAVTSASITPTVALVDNTWYWLRMRLQLTNGANSVGTLDIAADQAEEPTVWTANGSQTAAIITSVFNSTAPVEIGTFQNGTSERLIGQVSRCIVRDGFDREVLSDFDARRCYGNGYYNDYLDYGPVGNRYVPLTGRSSDNIYCADSNALDVTGDFEIVTRVRLNNWASPPAGSSWFINKHGLTTGGGYGFRVLNSGVFQLNWSTGAAGLSISSAAHGFTNGVTYWVKVTLDVDNDAGGNTVTFYWAADQTNEPTSWTQLGSPVITAGVTSIGVNTIAPALGTWYSGTGGELAGRLYRAIVRNGVGGSVVADFNANLSTPFGYSDVYGNGWVINSPKHKGNWTVGLPKIYDRSANNRAPVTFGAGTNSPKYLPYKGVPYVYLPGNSNRIFCNDSSSLDLTTELDIAAWWSMDDWTPSSSMDLGSKWATSNHSYLLRLNADGKLALLISGDGTTDQTATSSVAVPAMDGQLLGVRATWRASDQRVQFFISWDSPSTASPTWILLNEQTMSGSVTSIYNSTAFFGPGFTAATSVVGSIYRLILRSTIDGTVVADFEAAKCGQNGYTDYLGNIWGITRATSGRKGVVQSPAARTTKAVVLGGTDDNMTGPVAAIPPNTITDSLTLIPVVRIWDTPTNNGRIFDNYSANGMRVFNNGTTNQAFADMFDGVNTATRTAAAAVASGTNRTIAVRIATRGASGFAVKQAGSNNVTANNSAVGTASGSTFFLFSTPGAGSFLDAEFSSFLTFNRAITDQEVTTIEQLEAVN